MNYLINNRKEDMIIDDLKVVIEKEDNKIHDMYQNLEEDREEQGNKEETDSINEQKLI
jgi:rubrerythrin